MREDSRGAVVYAETSNRAGWRWDAVTDGVLLAAAASKTLTINDAQGRQAIASRVNVTNKSGQRCELLVYVTKSGLKRDAQVQVTAQSAAFPGDIRAKDTTFAAGSQAYLAVQGVEVSANPIRLENGDSIDIFERVVRIDEKNVGAGAQTGLGIRYSATLEPNHRF